MQTGDENDPIVISDDETIVLGDTDDDESVTNFADPSVMKRAIESVSPPDEGGPAEPTESTGGPAAKKARNTLSEAADNTFVDYGNPGVIQRAIESVSPDEGGPAEPTGGPAAKEAEKLERDGYVVIPVSLTSTASRAAWAARKRAELSDAIRGFTEYRGLSSNPLEDDVPLVNGGFGALGNASAFHCEWTREMRRIAHETVMRNKAIPVPPEYYLSQAFDRVMVRKRSQIPTAESWHRDEAGKPLKVGDALYGGWIALDDQIFSAIPGTQLGINPGGGFDKLTETDIANITRTHPKKKIKVPAGHMLIFNETIIHEVVGVPHKHTQARLFTAFYVSKQPEPILPIDDIVAQQAVAPLKSGQISPMLPAMYINQYRTNEARINALVGILKDAATGLHTIGPTAKYKGGEQVRVPGAINARGKASRVMASLAAMHARDRSIVPYGDYSKDDIDVLTPKQNPYNT
jgi:hypothetical protein